MFFYFASTFFDYFLSSFSSSPSFLLFFFHFFHFFLPSFPFLHSLSGSFPFEPCLCECVRSSLRRCGATSERRSPVCWSFKSSWSREWISSRKSFSSANYFLRALPSRCSTMSHVAPTWFLRASELGESLDLFFS